MESLTSLEQVEADKSPSEVDESPLEVDEETLELARHIVDVVADQKVEDVLLLDIRDVSLLADYFIIGSVNSTRQAKAVIDEVKHETRQTLAVKPLRIEGDASSGWVLMDYGSVIVHLFTPAMRAYYDLEGLWRGGRVVVRML